MTEATADAKMIPVEPVRHIPREFELPGEEAVLRKEGDRLVVEPAPRRSLLEVLASLTPIAESFPSPTLHRTTSSFEAVPAGYQF